MKNNSIYVSCPISIPEGELQRILNRLERFDFKDTSIKHWIRNTVYYPQVLTNADAVVIVLPGLRWVHSSDLPIGVARELDIAVKMKKPIFLAYKNMHDDINFYEAAVSITSKGKLSIKGREGTSHKFEKSIVDLEDKALTKEYKKTSEITEDIKAYSQAYTKEKNNNSDFEKSKVLLIKI